MKAVLPLALIGVGAVTLLCSFAVPTLMPPSSFWSEEDAKEFTELEDKLIKSEMQYKIKKQREQGAAALADGELPPALQDGIDRLNEMRERNRLAIKRPGQIAFTVRMIGIAILAAGVVTHLALGNG